MPWIKGNKRNWKFECKQYYWMGGMFLGCKEIESLNLSNFGSTKVNNMYFMFDGSLN